MEKRHLTRATVLFALFALIGSSLLGGRYVSRADQAERSQAAAIQGSVVDGDDSARLRGSKLSPELESVAQAAGEDRIRTIVQVRDSQSESLKQLLRRYGV